MTDAFSDANAIVNQVNQNGGESAARLLSDNINQAREDFKDTSRPSGLSNGYSNYMNVLSEELQKSGVLPELTVGWAKSNLELIGNGDSISDKDIQKFEKVADNNPIDQMMIRSLKEQAPDLRNESDDQRGRETVITAKDLDFRLVGEDSYRQNLLPDGFGTDPNARRAQVLFEKDPESGRDLFDFLDGINHQGERTGKVDRNDLITFNRMAANDEFGNRFTPEQIQTVKELEARWDYEGQKIHDGGLFVQDLTRESIARGIGEQNGIKEIKPSTMMDLARDQELNDKVASDHKLFDYLDGIGRGGKTPGLDGRVQRDDVVAFNALAERNDPRVANFTEDQIRTVRELETQWGYTEGYDENTVMVKSAHDASSMESQDESPLKRDESPEGMTQRLLEKDDRLFNLLDGIRNDGKKDGNVYRSDLVAFNETVKRDPEFAKQFNAEEIKTIKELEAHWDEGKHLHVNMDYMTKDSIAKGLGFKEVTVREQVEPRLNSPARETETQDLWAPEESLTLDLGNRMEEPRVRQEADRVEQMENELMKRSINDEPVDLITEGELKVSQGIAREFMRAAKQRPGEGPYQVATRLLLGEGADPRGHHTKIMELSRALKNDYQDRTGDRSDKMVQMRAGENFLTESNFMKILGQSPAFNERMNQRFLARLNQTRRAGR